MSEYVQMTLDNGIEEGQKKNRNRDNILTFRVTDEEREMIDRRMAQSGMKNRRAYLLKMAIDGRVVSVELESVNEMVRLLSNATGNINQISKRANQTGNIYAADLDELKQRYEELWEQAKLIMRKLSQL